MSESYDIYLDDERVWSNPNDGRTITCRSYYEFVQLITNRGLPNRIWFDHDLGYGYFTGADAARWLVEYCIEKKLPLPHLGVHSQNPVGRDNIAAILRSGTKVLEDLLKEGA